MSSSSSATKDGWITFKGGVLLSVLLLPLIWLPHALAQPENGLGTAPYWPFWLVLIPAVLVRQSPASSFWRRLAWAGLLLYCGLVLFQPEYGASRWIAVDRENVDVFSSIASWWASARFLIASVAIVMLLMPSTLRFVWKRRGTLAEVSD